ncbi:DMT family transporter [Lacticaseibacillus saniviri]|uniref:DMT family transporter n=1 Tax=Lacticaseibacillus saniviri TaxID=931533 RepID=UPI0009E739FD|nr:multidrug efflux SMR transporter [Lacticaseibacillus saniviri]
MGYVYLFIAIIGEVLGTSLLKATDHFKNIPLIFLFVLSYVVCFYFLSLSLESVDLNIAYALWGAIGIVLTTVASVVIWHESISLMSYAGLFFILLGSMLLELGHH